MADFVKPQMKAGRSLIEIFATTLLNYAFSFAFPLLSLILIRTHAFSSERTGWIMAGGFLFSACVQTQLGRLLDSGLARQVIAGAGFITLLGIAGIHFAAQSVLIAIVSVTFFLTGFNSIATITSLLIEGLVSSNSRGRFALLYASATSLGFFLSSVLAFLFLESAQGWLLFFDAVSTGFLCVALYRYARSVPQLARGTYLKQSAPLSQIIRSRAGLIAGVLIVNVAKVACLSLIPITYRRFDANGEQLAIIMFVVNDLTVFGMGLVLREQIDQLSSRAMILTFMIFSSLGLGLVPFVETQAENIVVTLLWSIAEVVAYPLIARLLYNSFPKTEVGTAAGIKAFLLRFSMAVTPAFAAISYRWNPNLLALSFALIPIAGGLLLLREKQYHTERRKPQDLEPVHSFYEWILLHYRQRIFVIFSTSIAILFLGNTFMTVRDRLANLLEFNDSFIAWQLPNIEQKHFAVLERELQKFIDNKPILLASLFDSENRQLVSALKENAIALSEGSDFRLLTVGLTTFRILYREGAGSLVIDRAILSKSRVELGVLREIVSPYELLKQTIVPSLSFLFLTILAYFCGLRLAKDTSRLVSQPLEKLSDIIQTSDVHEDLSQLSFRSSVLEANDLAEQFRSLASRLKNIEMKRIESERLSAIGSLASQVAHDIRSPLSALKMILAGSHELPEERRLVVRNAINRINDIANDLLQQRRKLNEKESGGQGKELETVMLVSLLDMVVTEKRIRYRESIEVEILGDFNDGYGAFVNVNAKELSRAISNLIDNAVEAVEECGTVVVRLKAHDGQAQVEINDDGKGISEKDLSKIGTSGFTLNKSNERGNGLGVHHAIRTVNENGGAFRIESKIGIGTTVTLNLPLSKAPSWFTNRIELNSNARIVSVDDDQTIHQIWSGRLSQELPKFKAKNHIRFTSQNAFEAWLSKNRSALDRYLIDFEFLSVRSSGLDLIERLGIQRQSILVTSRFEDTLVRQKVEELGIPMIPKSLAASVPICTVSPKKRESGQTGIAT